MFKKKIIAFLILALICINSVFSQAVTIDAAVANSAKEISEGIPKGTKIAVLNITSDYETLSDYIINELIVNLVGAKLFQVVPRSTIELELASREFDFQMTGSVSDDSQKKLGQFLGAGTIISGTVVRDTANSYRLTVNAIDLESFTYQSSYRISIANDNQLKVLIVGSGGIFYEDYTFGERIGIGSLNIFFGIGSLLNHHKEGWVTGIAEAIGISLFMCGSIFTSPGKILSDAYDYKEDGDMDGYNRMMDYYHHDLKQRKIFFVSGGITIGAGIIFGYVIPFFHHKPIPTIAENNFPIKLELVLLDNNTNGLILSYNKKY